MTYIAEDPPPLGGRVLVPLKKGTHLGLVTSLQGEEIPSAKKIQKIIDQVPVVPKNLLSFFIWIADYYLAPLGQVIRYALPASFFKRYKKKQIQGFEGPLRPQREGPSFDPGLLFEEETRIREEKVLRILHRALEEGWEVLWLWPQRDSAEATALKIEKNFPVTLYHGGLRDSIRKERWLSVLKGECPLVIGTRSALFLPFQRLGLVLVSDEEDEAYKEEQGFRYQARDLALVRAKREKAQIYLVSAAPSVKTFFWATKGKYQLERGNIKIPHRLEIVDLTREKGLLSQKLINACRITLAKGKQIFLFLNRLGYAPVLQCQDCGYVWTCSRCQHPLHYHRAENRLKCHWCRETRPAPPLCPRCEGTELKYLGTGVERLEEKMQKLFPAARINRFDAERQLSPSELEKVDILIGTRKVGFRIPLPRLRLIGVVLADQMLCLPFFQAAERTYQVLKKLSLNPAEWVIIQTFHPEHHVFQGLRYGYEFFYQEEITRRQEMAYPPFSRLAEVSLEGEDLLRLAKKIEEISSCLSGRGEIEVFGPHQEKRRGRFSLSLLLKGPYSLLREGLINCLSSDLLKKSPKIQLHLDFNPY